MFVLLALVAGCGSSGSDSQADDRSETSPTAVDGGTEESTTTVPTPAEPAAPDASPYVVGFGDLGALSFPAGDPGELTIISTGAQDELSDSVTVIVRNNTGDPMSMAPDRPGHLGGTALGW